MMALLEIKFSILLFCSVTMFAKFHPSLYVNLRTVNIENGEIMGEENENYFAFKGIPYAESERFSLPRPYLRKWYDIRKFDKFGSVCSQYDHWTYKYQGNEDCLTLNVFVPKRVIESNELASVIFFIHGGNILYYINWNL